MDYGVPSWTRSSRSSTGGCSASIVKPRYTRWFKTLPEKVYIWNVPGIHKVLITIQAPTINHWTSWTMIKHPSLLKCIRLHSWRAIFNRFHQYHWPIEQEETVRSLLRISLQMSPYMTLYSSLRFRLLRWSSRVGCNTVTRLIWTHLVKRFLLLLYGIAAFFLCRGYLLSHVKPMVHIVIEVYLSRYWPLSESTATKPELTSAFTHANCWHLFFFMSSSVLIVYCFDLMSIATTVISTVQLMSHITDGLWNPVFQRFVYNGD